MDKLWGFRLSNGSFFRLHLPIMVKKELGGAVSKKPVRFPIKFKLFLRIAIGARSYGERLPIFRKYYREALRANADEGSLLWGDGDKAVALSIEATDRKIETLSRTGVSEEFCVRHLIAIPEWRQKKRTEQRRNAAKSRWEKAKKKSVDRDKKKRK